MEPRPIDVWDSEKDVNYLIRIVAARVGNASVTRTLVTVKMSNAPIKLAHLTANTSLSGLISKTPPAICAHWITRECN